VTPRLVATFAVLALGGCSVIAVRGPRTSPTTQVVCESTYAPPVIDAALAIAGAALLVWGLTGREDPEGHTATARDFAAVPGGVAMATFGISSAYGFSKVASCKQAAREAPLRGRK